MVETSMYDGNLQPLIQWFWSPRAVREKPPPYPEFISWAEQQYPAGYELTYYPTVIRVRDDLMTADWYPGYPHAHSQTMGWDASVVATLLYLEVPTSGGEIGVGGLNEDDPYTFITPAPGLVVKVDGQTWHGVKPVLEGQRTAIAIVGHPP